jgi:phosphopantothenoylcysteine decarboxylase / phosphopantothenate---cysteine ligase
MGRALALEAFRLGADVTVIHRDTFPAVTNIPVDSSADMREAVHHFFSEGGGADMYISAAAISDFAPKKYPGKIPSGKKVTVELDPLPKLLGEVIREYAPVTVAFKIGAAPEKQSKQMLKKGVAAVLMNPTTTMGSREGEYTLLSATGQRTMKGPKEAIAHWFWKEITDLI